MWNQDIVCSGQVFSQYFLSVIFFSGFFFHERSVIFFFAELFAFTTLHNPLEETKFDLFLLWTYFTLEIFCSK